MIGVTAAALALAVGPNSASPVVAVSPIEIANATKIELTFNGGRVSACTVTATSGNPRVDRYVCDAARACGDKYRNADDRAACLANKRQELAERMVQGSGSRE